MAYDAFGGYTGEQRDPYEEERLRQEEEDRKRREEEERLAAAGNVAGALQPIAPVQNQNGPDYDQSFRDRFNVFRQVGEDRGETLRDNMSASGASPIKPDEVVKKEQPTFGDKVGQAFDQRMQGVKDRFGQVQQAFDDPGKAFQDRMNAATGQSPIKPDEVVKKEQVETRADGSSVVKTTHEVPAEQPQQPQQVIPGPQAPQAGGGRGFVNPAPARTETPAPAPVAGLPTDYNQRIAQMESGGNADIGYHDRSVSSAFGKYGITDKAWTDAQRANPALAGVRKDQATPDQMEAAQSTVTSNNARYLGKLGVEVNPNTLAAAHFIGAQGLSNYLRDGSISESAAKTNGGYDKTKAIIDQRLGGVAAPASGAAQAVAPVMEAPQAAQPPMAPEAVSPYSLGTGQPNQGLRMPAPAPVASPATNAINTYQSIQNDPMALLQLRQDETAPAFIRERAGAQAYELLNRERKTAAAEQQVEKMVASGDQTGIAKTLATKPKTEEGSFLKAVLYARLGLTDLAKSEQEKLGAGTKWSSVTGPDGENALVKVSADGMPIEGVKADGSAFTPNELIKFGGNAGVKFTKPDVSMQDVERNGEKGRVITTYDRNNKPTTMVESGGKTSKYDSSWKPVSIGTAAEKAEGAAAVKLRYAGPTSYTEAGAKAAGEFNFSNGTNIGYAAQQPGAPLVDLNTGRPVQMSSNGVITTTQAGTPGAAATGQTPQQIATGTAVGKVAQTQFVEKTVPAVLEQGNNGRDIATARRQQVGIIENNPSILDIYNGSGTQYDQGRNVISKLLTGAYNENNSGDFYKDVKATGLDSNQRSALEQMWNLTSGINGKTLKTNTGGGPISNADMKTNQAANLQNFTETTPLGALQVINRSKFTGDLDTAKAAFIAKNPNLTDDVKFNTEWSKESARYTKAYEGIADARAQFLKPFAPPRDANKEQLSVFRDKVFKSFEMYPVPAYDAESSKWSYGTANAERAAARKLLGR